MESTAMMSGVVKWYDDIRGYGFIMPAGVGKDVFVPKQEVGRAGLATLHEGQHVSFEMKMGPNGRPFAVLRTPDGDDRKGTVITYNPDTGIGFIRSDGGREVFVHRSTLEAAGLDTLRDNQRVEFDTHPTRERVSLAAKNLRLLKDKAA